MLRSQRGSSQLLAKARRGGGLNAQDFSISPPRLSVTVVDFGGFLIYIGPPQAGHPGAAADSEGFRKYPDENIFPSGFFTKYQERSGKFQDSSKMSHSPQSYGHPARHAEPGILATNMVSLLATPGPTVDSCKSLGIPCSGPTVDECASTHIASIYASPATRP